ncbi:MAG: AraC family transcriptional regulator [Calditrichaeota bacterium]|nr:AraC family transcriptional regulator [Calditrichota bacterium]
MIKHFVSILISFGIIQSIVFYFTLRRKDYKPNPSNKILSYFMIIISLSLVGRWFWVNRFVREYPHIYLLIDILFYLYGPFIYLYVKALINQQINLKKEWFHFIPITLHFLTMIQYLLLSPVDYLAVIDRGDIWVYPYDWALAMLHIAVYLLLSNKLISDAKDHESENYSYKSEIDLLAKLIILMWVFLFGWFHSFLVEVFDLNFMVLLYRFSIFWMCFPMIAILVGYYAISKPEVFAFKKIEKYEGSLLTQDDIDHIKSELEQYMKTQKPFLMSRLNLDQLAEMIDVSKKDLSRVINECYKMNFFDFINSYRLEEFKQNVNEIASKAHNIFTLALECGFNSKSAFNSFFKKKTGITPSQFVKKLSVS